MAPFFLTVKLDQNWLEQQDNAHQQIHKILAMAQYKQGPGSKSATFKKMCNQNKPLELFEWTVQNKNMS